MADLDAGLVFLRPLWLWGFAPLVVLAAVWHRRRRPSRGAWKGIVDEALVPYVIESGEAGRPRGAWLLFGGWALALLILSGPVFERQPVPVFEARRTEVILFDLSRSMLASDVVPDRLTRARYKVDDLLRRSGGARTALVAFAERPYVISPLTDDAATLEAFLPSLDPSIMPVQGSRPDLAIERALELLEQGGGTAGHLILVTDSAVDESSLDAAREVAARGHVLSVLGVGTAAGVPLRGADGRFVRRADGAIVVPQLDLEALDALARAGGGTAVAMTSDARDLDAIGRESTRVGKREEEGGSAPLESWWIERAPWLLPPLALCALLLFRRGVIA